MQQALALESRTLVLQIHQLLQDLDAARFRQDASEALDTRLGTIRASLDALMERLAEDESAAALRARLAELQDIVSGWTLPEPASARAKWMELKARMQPAYEQVVDALGVQQVHVPRLRPTNYKRNAMHMTSWIVALVTIGGSQGDWRMLAVAGGIAVAGWTMETARRFSPKANDVIMAAFNPVAHPHEAHRINSATWYATALTILALFGSVPMAAVAVTALGVGDPLAAIVGRRWGKTRTMNGRSLEGSTAFFAASSVACFGVLLVMVPSLTLGQAAIMASVGSLAGAVAEMLCRRVDDNFGIPLASGGAVVLVSLALGVPL
jgi:dolichol kinase